MNKLDTITLENGLTIYLYQDTRRHSTFFQFVTFFGGVTKDFLCDGEEYHMQDGIAHILEHYLVECNENGNFLETLGKRQMNTNASTHFDITRFYFETVEDVSFGISTMLDGIYHVTFNREKLEKLKNPIYQEIRGKSDSKFYHSGILSLENLFSNLSYRSIGGTLEEVERTTIEDLKVCYKAFYQPSNQFIVVAGNFDKEEVLKTIQDFYSTIEIPTHEVSLIDLKEPITVSKKKDTLYYPTPMDYVDISFKVDISSLTPIERLNLDFYLGCFYHSLFGIVSPLYKELVDQKIISASIHGGDTKLDHFLIISIGGYTHNAKVFQKRILETIQEMNSFDEENFELDKRSAIIRMILRDENIMNMIMPFVDNVANFQYPYLDEVADVEAMTFQDYVRTIQSLDFSHYTIVTIKEKES